MLGTEGPSYTPGSRGCTGSWINSDGSLWLFGGEGLSLDSTVGVLNDLWKYNTVTKQWSFMGGSKQHNDNGNYTGTLWPASRQHPITWTNSGKLWLYGGYGSQLANNDLWYYENGTWSWISGDIPQASLYAAYGSRGIGTNETLAGARSQSAVWVDNQGLIWIFGGLGYNEIAFGTFIFSASILIF